MAYAAVTSLMETLSLNFLQSEAPFPLEDLEAQIRDDANQNLGLLQQILEAQMREMDVDESSSKRLRIKACLPRFHGKQQLAWDSILLTSRLSEVVEVKQKIVSLHQNLGLLQQSLEKSEIACHDEGMKDLEAQMRDASFKGEERIEMELSAIYLAKGKGDSLHIAACLLRLHEIFKEAEKQTDYQRNELIRIQIERQQLGNVSLIDVKSLFSHLKLLRVVDMRSRFSNVDKALNVFANLVHLRYVALFTDKTFDVKLFEHWNMQSFIVSGDGVTLNSSEAYRICKMPQLRNFCIGGIFALEISSVVHRNLENISWLDSKLCIKDLFTVVPNLKTLGVDGGYYDNSVDCFYNFVHLEQLEKLSIRRWMNLNLVMCSIPWATSLPNLKKLSFLKSNLQWSELSAISMLPNLEVLKLIDACEGPEWETFDGGFHRLKRYSLVASAKWIQEEQNYHYGNDALLVRSENIWVSLHPSDISLTL
nr:putative late blight resistance protein homolog R1A-10 isoform X1 [Ipomoea batatas]